MGFSRKTEPTDVNIFRERGREEEGGREGGREGKREIYFKELVHVIVEAWRAHLIG